MNFKIIVSPIGVVSTNIPMGTVILPYTGARNYLNERATTVWYATSVPMQLLANALDKALAELIN